MGVNSAMIMDFHGDGHPRDPGDTRLKELAAFYDACRKQSGPDFLLIPAEEANVHFGGHWALAFPKPVFWHMDRKPAEPFSRKDAAHGTVYRVADAKELLDLVRDHYGRNFAISGAVLTIVTNLAVVIADIMAVSDAFSILTGLSRMFFVAATAFFVWYILVFQDYQKITRALVVLSLPLYLYVAAAVLTHPGVGQLLHDVFLPKMQATSAYAENIVALFGSFLTPYIIIWQTSSRSDPEHEHHAADSFLSTAVTFVLACSIMIAASAVLHFNNAPDMTTRQAAEALRPAVGDWGPIVFAIGIIGSGMVALPVLTASMCFDLAQAVGWKSGLSEKPWEAKRFYMLISAAVFVAAGANYMRINPVTALYWSMILAGVLLIPTLIFILLISNDRRIMRTVNTRWQNFWLGAATGGAAAAGLIYIRYALL